VSQLRVQWHAGLLIAAACFCLVSADIGRAGEAPQPAATGTPPPSCSEVPGSVAFDGVEVVPARPRVGDDVELTFNVRTYVYRVERIVLEGAAPLLEERSRDGTHFTLRAVGAGTAAVQLAVTYRTEIACTDANGTYFSEGPTHTSTSEPFAVEITTGPSPTPPSTTTSTPTPTNPPGSCCSPCAGLTFPECLRAAERGECSGWGDPCATPTPACREVAGVVAFRGLQISPAQPRVGDDVELRFDVDFAVYSVEQLSLDGAAPLLAEQSSSGTVFQVKAVRAGTAAVHLVVAYGTEIGCTDADGHIYFQEGPSHRVTSPPYEVEVSGASSPTPTSAATPKRDGGGGCQLGAGRADDRAALFTLLGAIAMGGVGVLAKRSKST